MSRGKSFIFRAACGCAFGLADIGWGIGSEGDAWNMIYDTAEERREAKAAGVHVTREAWEQYRHTVYDELRGQHRCGQVVSS